MRIHPAADLQEPYITKRWKIQRGEALVETVILDEEGSFTVEASFLVPLVCLLVIAMMMSGLYLCDQNVTKSFLNERAMELSRDGEDYTWSDMERDRKELEENLFIAQLNDFSLTKTKARIHGTATIAMNVSLPMITEWVGDVWEEHFSITVDVGKPYH